ncbi:MAG: TIR domain-containing protein [Nitrospira sp.]|nr:MAG: TIR domain-containing protein [Nitrospira sp.]
MGGGGGGSSSIGNIQSLVDKAKQELRKSEQQGEKRNVFISFAYEDINEVNLLRGQAKNENSPIEFNDWSVSEPIDSERAPYIKQKIAERIQQSSLTVVFLSNATAKSKWVAWEIEESLKMGKQVLGVYPKDNKPASFPEAINANKIKCVTWPDLASTIAKLK